MEQTGGFSPNQCFVLLIRHRPVYCSSGIAGRFFARVRKRYTQIVLQ